MELSETEVCFLHTQVMGTNVRLPNMHRILSRSILSLQDPRQNQNSETIPICNAVLYFPPDSARWPASSELFALWAPVFLVFEALKYFEM